MDLLASMNLDDLPEQQTRTVELMERFPDFDGQLGFDCCCHCGTSLVAHEEDAGASSPTVVHCPSCRRVKYCSEACRIADASAAATVMLEEEEGDTDSENQAMGSNGEDTAMGHSAVVCVLLSLCDDDEAVESGEKRPGGWDAKRREAAQDRVRSEDESYPATLANVLAEGPCYQHVIRAKFSWRRRQGNGSSSSNNNNRLVLHVVGASVDSELWGGFDLDADLSHSGDGMSATAVPCLRAYADALAELNVPEIELVFVGPECPSAKFDRRVLMKGSTISSGDDDDATGDGDNDGELFARSIQGMYRTELLESNGASTRPDIVVFFNPGFTVPDYEWRETLASIEPGTPFLLATNTELEGIADCQYLLEQDKIRSLPPGLADVLGLYSSPDEDCDASGDNNLHDPSDTDHNGAAFFSVNPFAGNRVRQSGTMANDLYVKNRWILGGYMDKFDPTRRASTSAAASLGGTKKKQRRDMDGSVENSKRSNPALI
jgi:hypothetical protein